MNFSVCYPKKYFYQIVFEGQEDSLKYSFEVNWLCAFHDKTGFSLWGLFTLGPD